MHCDNCGRAYTPGVYQRDARVEARRAGTPFLMLCQKCRDKPPAAQKPQPAPKGGKGGKK